MRHFEKKSGEIAFANRVQKERNSESFARENKKKSARFQRTKYSIFGDF